MSGLQLSDLSGKNSSDKDDSSSHMKWKQVKHTPITFVIHITVKVTIDWSNWNDHMETRLRYPPKTGITVKLLITPVWFLYLYQTVIKCKACFP